MYIKSPCKECNKHEAYCHTVCSLYKKYVEENKKEREKIAEAKEKIYIEKRHIYVQNERVRRRSIKQMGVKFS